MIESVFSFLPSYFSIIFLTKCKISKFVSLFLRHIGPKWCWPIRLQDFKSNISLEQSNEIVYFFTCWYQKLRVDRKILGWCGQKWLWPSWSQGEWMNEWMNWADFSCWCKFRKVKNYIATNYKLRIIRIIVKNYKLRIIFWVAVAKYGHVTLISMNGWI